MNTPLRSRLSGSLCGLLLLMAGCLFSACGGPDEAVDTVPADDGPLKILLQTDWYAQPEHGGFYQALVNGYYAQEGLQVEILPGGPNASTLQKAALGTVHFSLGRSDEVIRAVGQGVPVVMVGALMQKDPQALMYHQGAGIEGFEDLDGRSLMAVPGLAFLDILRAQYDIDFSVIPSDYGMDRFLADEAFIQQIFVTNEPYYAAQQGAEPGVLLLSDSGFQPYRVWYTSRAFARSHPEAVAAFTRASIRGWQDYLSGDRDRTHALIASRNPRMTPEFMEYGFETMRDHQLVAGDSGDPAVIGHISRRRIAEQIDQLLEIGVIEHPLAIGMVFNEGFLPEEIRAAGEAVDSASAPVSPLELSPERTAADDLAIALPDGSSGFASRDALRAIGTDSVSRRLAGEEGESRLEVLSLDRLLRALEVDLAERLLTAECVDGYVSVFEQVHLVENEPYLVLAIDGQPVPQWAAAHDRPEAAPYSLQIAENGDLLDPRHKNPWGVQRLTIQARAEALKPVLARIDTGDARVEAGLGIYLNNCASCHVLDAARFGGTLSNRTATILAVHAAHNEPYFRNMLQDPAGTNPTAARMPAVHHYTEEQIQALIALLKDYGQN